MVTNVTSLLKTVKAVEDEHTRGTRALESSIEAIAQEIRAFDSPEVPRQKAEPEDLIRATRPITIATGKAVSAGKSLKQEDIIVAANMGRKAISDMLTTCKVERRKCFFFSRFRMHLFFFRMQPLGRILTRSVTRHSLLAVRLQCSTVNSCS